MARILVVEDNPQNLKLASVLLKRAGHQVVPAYDSKEAEEALADGLPDLILMDLGLPGKDGYALTRELRQRPETSEVPILAVTSYAMKGDHEKALAAGCSDYLPKPIHASEFLQRIKQLLALREFVVHEGAGAGSVAPTPPTHEKHASGRRPTPARAGKARSGPRKRKSHADQPPGHRPTRAQGP
jgi:two-component system cell cycle response regulator DivK